MLLLLLVFASIGIGSLAVAPAPWVPAPAPVFAGGICITLAPRPFGALGGGVDLAGVRRTRASTA